MLGVERALLQFVGLLVDCVDLKRDVEPLAVGVADGTELIVRACRQARHLRPEFTLGLDQRNAVGLLLFEGKRQRNRIWCSDRLGW